jgi:hypothetical protein
MTPSEIIQADHKRFGHSQADTARLMETMNAMIQKQVGHLIQHGDSLLFVVNIDKNDADVSIYTADSPTKIKSALKYFVGQVKHAGFKRMYGEDGGPVLQKTLKLLKGLGVNIQKSDKPHYLWMADL